MNVISITGRLGANPERVGDEGCGFRVADNFRGGREQRTTWHRVITFGALAQSCFRNLSTGRLVHIVGRLESSEYEKDGRTLTQFTVIASAVEFLDPRRDEGRRSGRERPRGGDGWRRRG